MYPIAERVVKGPNASAIHHLTFTVTAMQMMLEIHSSQLGVVVCRLTISLIHTVSQLIIMRAVLYYKADPNLESTMCFSGVNLGDFRILLSGCGFGHRVSTGIG